MQDYRDEDEFFGEEPTDEELEAIEEALSDPGTVAFLDQQEAEFAGNREKWVALYGFDHDCHCSQDYTEGDIGTVTKCFMQLTSQALARCAEATHEIKVYSAMLTEMLAVNNDLVKMMEDLGHEKALQDYFGETIDLEEDVISDLEAQFTDDTGVDEDEGEAERDGEDKVPS